MNKKAMGETLTVAQAYDAYLDACAVCYGLEGEEWDRAQERCHEAWRDYSERRYAVSQREWINRMAGYGSGSGSGDGYD